VDLGDAIHDTATLSGGFNPTGSITFKLYGPNDSNCTGTAIFTNTVTVNGNHNYASDEFTPKAAGTYRWIANYSGDANNAATNNACNDANENVVVKAPPPPPPPGCVSNCGGGGSTPNPQIRVVKTGPASAAAGSDVTFTLTVTNPGTEPLTSLAVTDQRCDASAPALQSNNGDSTPSVLNPGDVWVYTCASHTAVTDTTLHNVVTTCAQSPASQQVCATDDADVTLIAPAQQVEPLLPGVARLRGPSGCISRSTHVLRVTGSRIARVSFYVDGKYVGTRTKPNSGSAYTVTVRGAKLRRGSHRVVARVTYQAGTTPQSRTLNLTFARCARALTPKFTG
jgi:hypothetical protein